ncbi:MAG: fimbrillin family protein, partial [Bacteroidales bacterium]|nr:fimbrillin family protein [Bacteroidales bacterium]
PQSSGDAVKFSVAMNSFDVKATDNAFEAGDEVGIFAGTPINATNVKGSISGTTLTPATEIKWVEDQTASTKFAAYLPYNSAVTSPSFIHVVNTDQTAYAAYQASDLLAASVTAAPRTTVAFALKHQLSKLIVIPTCEDPAETVTEVVVKELVIESSVDLLAGTVAPGTAKSGIKAGAAVSGNGGQGFVAILVPQTVQLGLTVTTSANRVIEYSLAEAKALASGKAYKAEISVKKASVEPGPATPAEFTVSIVDWESAEDLSFYDTDAPLPNPNEGKWSVIGLGGDWDTDIWMEETSEGVWEADITYAAGDSFKLRQDGKWSTETETHAEAGMPAAAEGTVPVDGSEYGLWGSNNKGITLAAAGEYHLKFITDGYKFYVTPKGEPAPEHPEITALYILGEATDNGWALNTMPQFTKEGNVFTLTTNLATGKQFRLMTQNADWYPGIVREIATGNPVYCASQSDWDANNTVWDHFSVSESGSYEIVFDAAAWTLSLTRKGDAQEAPIEVDELYLLGSGCDTGWSIDDMVAFTKDGNVFTLTAHLNNTGIVRFLCQKEPNAWYPALVKGDGEGKIKYATSATDPEHFSVEVSGTYLITVDIAARTYSIVLQSADAEPDWYVIGDVYTEDSEAEAWAIDYPMTKGDDGKWSITINVRGAFKFRAYVPGTTGDACWATQLGMWASDTNEVIDIANTYGLANNNQGNKDILFAETGQYTLVLDGSVLTATKL